MTVDWYGTEIEQRVRQAAMRGVIRGTEGVREEADSLMNETPRTGREYRRRGVVHVASLPGNPPAPDTGSLRQSLETSYDTPNLTGTVNAGAGHAAAMEFGTERVEQRPFMRPALANRLQPIVDDVAAEVDAVLR